MVSTATTQSIRERLSAAGSKAPITIRTMAAKAATLTVTDMNAVTEVGAPS